MRSTYRTSSASCSSFSHSSTAFSSTASSSSSQVSSARTLLGDSMGAASHVGSVSGVSSRGGLSGVKAGDASLALSVQSPHSLSVNLSRVEAPSLAYSGFTQSSLVRSGLQAVPAIYQPTESSSRALMAPPPPPLPPSVGMPPQAPPSASSTPPPPPAEPLPPAVGMKQPLWKKVLLRISDVLLFPIRVVGRVLRSVFGSVCRFVFGRPLWTKDA